MSRQLEICKAMAEINLLSSYEFTSEQVKHYANKILEIYSNTTADDIEILMGAFFRGTLEFNPHKGVLNFTANLKKIVKLTEEEQRKSRRYQFPPTMY